MSILTWAVHDRPRERLRQRGPGALSHRELVALLVGSGGCRGSALDVAGAVLDAASGSLRALAAMEGGELERVPGVGPVTGARIQAALELGRRAATEEGARSERIRGPRDVFRRIGPRLRDLAQEEFHVVLLDARHRVLRERLVTRGTLDASLVHPREVFRGAILARASALILVHNHPSGDPTPSPEDRAVTRQLADAGRAVGIHVLDHVIVGDLAWVSMADEGMM